MNIKLRDIVCLRNSPNSCRFIVDIIDHETITLFQPAFDNLRTINKNDIFPNAKIISTETFLKMLTDEYRANGRSNIHAAIFAQLNIDSIFSRINILSENNCCLYKNNKFIFNDFYKNYKSDIHEEFIV